VRGRIARRKSVFQCLVDCLLRANLFFGAKPIVRRRTWSIAPQPVEFLG
jgi:hypothetical protein